LLCCDEANRFRCGVPVSSFLELPMFGIYYRGWLITSYHCPVAASAVAIARFTTGQLLRGEVQVIKRA
jgi:hypothetical protein